MEVIYTKLDNVGKEDLIYKHIQENPTEGMNVYHEGWLSQDIKDYIEEGLDPDMVGYRVWTSASLIRLDCNKISRMAFAKATLNCSPDELDTLEKVYVSDEDMTLYQTVFELYR